MKQYLYLLICFLAVDQLSAQDNNRNYVGTYIPIRPVQNLANIPTSDSATAQKTIQYLDAFGRPDQTIFKHGSPRGHDIIQPIVYNTNGLQEKTYLPFVKANNNGRYYSDEINAVNWQSFYGDEASYSFSQGIFEKSPMSRILEKGAPGADWQLSSGHTVKTSYGHNCEGEVLCWQIDANGILENKGGTVVNDKCYYNESELFKTITKNQNWTSKTGRLNTIEQFKDKEGRIVLVRTYVDSEGQIQQMDTYYVYDSFGLLRFMIPPKLTREFLVVGIDKTITPRMCVSTPITLDDIQDGVKESIAREDEKLLNMSRLSSIPMSYQNFLDQCYCYIYDYKHRLVVKKIPGTEEVHLVYDALDRLILTQNGVQRSKATAEWTFVKYDIMNRPILTGIYRNGATREVIQGLVNTEKVCYETAGAVVHGYTNNAFPRVSQANDYLIINYYDNYSIPCEWGYEFTTVDGYSQVQSQSVKGMLTGKKVKSLENNTWMEQVYFYNKYGLVIQVFKKNQLGGHDRITTDYSFTGNITQTQQHHAKLASSSPIVIANRFSYDNGQRLTHVYHQIDSQPEVLLVQNVYNELGQLKEKNLHGGVQSIDYSYNIRGWITSINNTSLSNDGITNNDTGDLFGMEIDYNQATAGLCAGNQYTGNISAIKWRNRSQSQTQAYVFTYDAVNRLKKADFYYANDSAWSQSADYDVSGKDNDGIGYDLHGNITSLIRKEAGGTVLDELTYQYRGDQLYNVDDKGNNGGFNQFSTGSGREYTFDANGNLINDMNRGHSIAYNLLNLPKNINNEMIYEYSAEGEKLKKYSNGKETVYIGNMVYQDGKLATILTSEGRVVPLDNQYNYEYNITDHLGNTRVSFFATDNKAVVLQYKDYYPFGLTMGVSLTNDNKFRFNGKEHQDEVVNNTHLDWYDYGARYYDPSLAMWHTVDPLAEKYPGLSPYVYCYNNPINYVDPWGLEGIPGGKPSWMSDDLWNIFNKAWNEVPWGTSKIFTPDGNGGSIGESIYYSDAHKSYGYYESSINTSYYSNSQGGYTTDNSGVAGAGAINLEWVKVSTPTVPQSAGDGVALMEKGPAFDGGFWDWANKINHLGKREWNGKYIDDDGNVIGTAPITGMPPSFIGGPLRKGQSALKVGKYFFNPTAFHSVKEGVLAFANPKNFSHIVGSNPDLMFKGGKIWLTGTKTGGYFGKSYETGMTIADFLKLF